MALDFEKYRNTGWGLSVEAFKALSDAMDTLPNISAIEFGSGVSTEFLMDYAADAEKELQFDSFDNDKKYKHPKAVLSYLVECKDKDYEEMFRQKEINWGAFKKRFWRPKTRQKNCFYNVKDYPLKENYNLAIVDGPHGNGRNIAYLLLKDKMQSGFILIDDFNHYDFVERASNLFNLEEICRVESPKDNFVLMKVL